MFRELAVLRRCTRDSIFPDRASAVRARGPRETLEKGKLLGLSLGVGALAVAGLLFGLQGDAPATSLEPENPDLVKQGAAVYASWCAACHGAKLEGQPDWRQRRADGKLPAPPHNASGHTHHHPDRLLIKLTKLGPAAIAGEGYESDMPAYAGVLSDADIRAVLSYIKSTWPAELQRRHDAINEQTATQ